MYCQQNLCQPCWVLNGDGYAEPADEEVDGEFIDDELTASSDCSETPAVNYCTDYCEDVWEAWQACGMTLEVDEDYWMTFDDCTSACYETPCPVEKKRSVSTQNFTWGNGMVYTGSSRNTTIPTYADPEPKYLGCYGDGPTRDVNGTSPISVSTVEECIVYCSGLLFPIAALQDGYQCFCGNTYNKHGYGTSTGCTMACADSDEICGGSYANSIYQTGFVGCYIDSPTRDMSYTQNGGGSVTVEGCRTDCFALTYKYAGLQDGNQCFCGDEYGHQGQDAGGCTNACSGNSAELCGSGYRNAVFTAQQVPTSN